MNKEISEVRRVYTNTDIQRKISDVLRNFNENELDEFCNKEYSKELFNLSFSLLVKYHKKDSIDSKNELIKRNGLNRWTYKYNIESKNYIYAISTQWYKRHDEFVQRWLNKNN
ncbi:hypothetical protein BTO15_14015 [Polaribacter sejongensis]|nr:hypothetical protein [Polaribacter sejongensis]AUC23141.1 hypothetical protein BTO15_14015 [Polaribacter sejongensis]